MKYKIQKASFFTAILVGIIYLVIDWICPLSGMNPKIGELIIFGMIFFSAGGFLVAGLIEASVHIKYWWNGRRINKMIRYYATRGNF